MKTAFVLCGIVVVTVCIIFYINHSEAIEEIVGCALWLPVFFITNLIQKEYKMLIADFYYCPLKRYFVRYSNKLVIDLMLPGNLELQYCKGHIIKHPDIKEIPISTQKILFECGLLKTVIYD